MYSTIKYEEQTPKELFESIINTTYNRRNVLSINGAKELVDECVWIARIGFNKIDEDLPNREGDSISFRDMSEKELFELIVDIGFGYDGCSTMGELKFLLEEFEEISKIGYERFNGKESTDAETVEG